MSNTKNLQSEVALGILVKRGFDGYENDQQYQRVKGVFLPIMKQVENGEIDE